MKVCGTCRHWKRLGEEPESWGVCEWFDSHEPSLPFWTKFNRSSGALSPDQAHCHVHAPLPVDQQREKKQGRKVRTPSLKLVHR